MLSVLCGGVPLNDTAQRQMIEIVNKIHQTGGVGRGGSHRRYLGAPLNRDQIRLRALPQNKRESFALGQFSENPSGLVDICGQRERHTPQVHLQPCLP